MHYPPPLLNLWSRNANLCLAKGFWHGNGAASGEPQTLAYIIITSLQAEIETRRVNETGKLLSRALSFKFLECQYIVEPTLKSYFT